MEGTSFFQISVDLKKKYGKKKIFRSNQGLSRQSAQSPYSYIWLETLNLKDKEAGYLRLTVVNGYSAFSVPGWKMLY